MLHWLDSSIAWSVQRRVIVLLLAAVLVMAGLYSARGAALDVLPDFMPPWVVVQTEAPGMGTTDVEQSSRRRSSGRRCRRRTPRSCARHPRRGFWS